MKAVAESLEYHIDHWQTTLCNLELDKDCPKEVVLAFLCSGQLHRRRHSQDASVGYFRGTHAI